MKCFYPVTTEKIVHIGKNGNIYKLDGIEKCISLYKALKANENFSTEEIKVKNSKEIEATIEVINNIHSKAILNAYKTGKPAKLANSSGVMWQPDLYNFALESAKTAKKASLEALKTGQSIALVGGGHHAERKTPLGFCTINTMAIAAIEATKKGKKVAIIDLDVHYSNGCFDILKNNPTINVYSIWNQKLKKWKKFESKNNLWHKRAGNIKEYFLHLKNLINEVNNISPDLIVYHLGLDVLESDRMGGIKGMNRAQLLRRERMIRDFSFKTKIPICIFIGGAYINWVKGSKAAIKQQIKNTKLQTEILKGYVNL